jgi:FkbM family methyltransferase
MLVDSLHGLLALYNDAALRHSLIFREHMRGRVPNPFDQDFFRARTEHPYFGYVLVQIDGCDDFWMVSHDDDLVAQHYFWYGTNGYEPLSVQVWIDRAKERTGDVLDIGAFSGLYALVAYFANMDNDVHLFEPTARAYARAMDNCRINLATGRIATHRLALSDGPRRVEFKHFRGPLELGSGASYVAKEGETVHDVEICAATTLDDVCAEHGLEPQLVKIDVEEAEVDVLRGGERLIESQTASFLIEVVPGTCEAVLDLLHAYDCQVVDERGRRLVPIGHNVDRLHELVGATGFVNVLFDPPGRRV